MNILYYVIIFIILIVLANIYNKIKQDEDKNSSKYYYKMVDKYLINPNSLGMNNKPILWIHIHNDTSIIPEVNSRFWLNFYSRATKHLNQPYQYLTIKSIIDKCGNDFNICLIDDDSFVKLLPNWTTDLNIVAIPIRIRIRLLALASLLNIYGGMLVPSSFICFKSLKELYHNSVSQNRMFVGELANRTANTNFANDYFIPSQSFMGCESGNEEMSQFIKTLEIIISKDFTAQVDFLGEINEWFANGINLNKIKLISANYFGIKKDCGTPIEVEELVGSTFIKLCPKAVGMYIPWNDIINRTSIQWFARLSPKQILESDTVIGKHLLINN